MGVKDVTDTKSITSTKDCVFYKLDGCHATALHTHKECVVVTKMPSEACHLQASEK